MSLTTPADPQALVGRWIRLERDEGRPPHLGLLLRATPIPDHPGLWNWALHTAQGSVMFGGPHLPAEVLTRKHTNDVARARRALTRQIRADRQTRDALIEFGKPAGVMRHKVDELEQLQESLTAQIHA